jgi:hypothetical protein
MNKWSQKTELPVCRLVRTAGLGLSKFYNWKDRYGRANEHNAPIPRDFWLEQWEVQPSSNFRLNKHGFGPAELGGHAQVEFSSEGVFATFQNEKIMGPADFSHQWCEFWMGSVSIVEQAGAPGGGGGKPASFGNSR